MFNRLRELTCRKWAIYWDIEGTDKEVSPKRSVHKRGKTWFKLICPKPKYYALIGKKTCSICKWQNDQSPINKLTFLTKFGTPNDTSPWQTERCQQTNHLYCSVRGKDSANSSKAFPQKPQGETLPQWAEGVITTRTSHIQGAKGDWVNASSTAGFKKNFPRIVQRTTHNSYRCNSTFIRRQNGNGCISQRYR